jgi:hypothetical protein
MRVDPALDLPKGLAGLPPCLIGLEPLRRPELQAHGAAMQP